MRTEFANRPEKVQATFTLREGQLADLEAAIKCDTPVWGPDVGALEPEWFALQELRVDIQNGYAIASVVLLQVDRP